MGTTKEEYIRMLETFGIKPTALNTKYLNGLLNRWTLVDFRAFDRVMIGRLASACVKQFHQGRDSKPLLVQAVLETLAQKVKT